MTKTRRHVVVSGRVQGVCYRDSVREEAQVLGVSGWVRNLYDGRVEAVLEGDAERVERLVAYLREGPRLARVTDVQIDQEDFKGEFRGFSITFSK